MPLIAERILNEVTTMRQTLPANEYREIVSALADSFGAEAIDLDVGHLPNGYSDPAYSDAERDNAASLYQ